jgi:tyrosyl-tRNA synthetase
VLSGEEIDANARTYQEQAFRVLLDDPRRYELRFNSEWLDMPMQELFKLARTATVAQMLERDDFAKRRAAGTPINLVECLYPLMQGWDSVEIRADVELGGTEQLYNLMVGRDLQRTAGQEPQICMTMPILRGTDGEKKMGKTAGNYIGLNEPAKDQFGKTMRIPDGLMREWFTLLTDRTTADIDALLAGKPNEAKKVLGADIVRFYHGQDGATAVLEDWRKQFENKGDPDDMPEVSLPVGGDVLAVELIVAAGLAKSKNEARQKITEGAFNYGPDRTKPADVKATVPVADGLVLRLGRKIVRVKVG